MEERLNLRFEGLEEVDNTGSRNDHLCKMCSRLDIRALYHRARSKSKTQRKLQWHDLYSVDMDDDSVAIFKHQPNLLSLKRASLHCYLCSEIWQTFCCNSGLSEDIDDVDLSKSGDKPLYAVFADEESQHDRLPKLTIFQHARHELTRVVAAFDVCRSRDSPPSDVDYRFDQVLHPYSGSDECMSLVLEWMDVCERLHRSCKERAAGLQSPTRLIDLKGDSHLIDGTGEERFVALSYSWGVVNRQ